MSRGTDLRLGEAEKFQPTIVAPSSSRHMEYTFLSSQLSVYYLRTILMMGGWGLYTTLKASLIRDLLQNSNSRAQDSREQISNII